VVMVVISKGRSYADEIRVGDMFFSGVETVIAFTFGETGVYAIMNCRANIHSLSCFVQIAQSYFKADICVCGSAWKPWNADKCFVRVGTSKHGRW